MYMFNKIDIEQPNAHYTLYEEIILLGTKYKYHLAGG